MRVLCRCLAAQLIEFLCQCTPFSSHFDEAVPCIRVLNTQGHLFAMFSPFNVY